MLTILQAIARREGYGVPGARPTRNNNPGDLMAGPESAEFGAIGNDGPYAIFPDAETGWMALRRWLSVGAKFDAHGTLVRGYMGATIQQVIYRFAPPSENDSARYVADVCEWTGLTPDTVLTSELLG
ncbi:MAG TPA: hypothetical protein VMQ76_03540 [Terracidiphilus sp.]|jgi:hypothetical protein|nr:hypothetical protein [Terracidiphilus sp.]